ncbi:MAG: response regulator, partial [bacterium]
MTENKKKILIVDDEIVIRNMLEDHLEEKYQVKLAKDGQEALGISDLGTFDLVISDINMPGIKGYKLLAEIKKRHPLIPTILITAYNVDEYIRLAKKYGISNIISKTIPFNFSEIDTVLDNLITGDIFGLEKYMLADKKLVKEFTIKSSHEGKFIREEFVKIFKDLLKNVGELKLVLDEIITNAIYHSPINEDGQEKYPEFSEVFLEPEEYIYVKSYIDNEKYGISVVDNKGNLKKETVLYKIDRHIHSEGILDGSGRG